MTKHHKASYYGLKAFDVHMGMFDYQVRFVVGDKKKAISYIAGVYEIEDWEVAGPDSEHIARAVTFHWPGYLPIIWFPKAPKSTREIATLAHEVAHALMQMFDWAHMNINFETEEVFGHAMGHLMHEALEEFKK